MNLREEVEHFCNPYNEIGIMNFMFKSYFIGNKKYRTKHEKMFSLLFQELEQQVTFGTGKGGLKKYGSKKFTADFLDRENKIVFEIDGPGHRTTKQHYKDLLKQLFFLEVHDIKTVRVTNEKVEELMEGRVQEIERTNA